MENNIFILNNDINTKAIYVGVGQFELPSGIMVDAILYKYNGIYKMMEASKFISMAKSDKTTTLDRIGDIIGPGYDICKEEEYDIDIQA